MGNFTTEKAFRFSVTDEGAGRTATALGALIAASMARTS